MPNQGQPGDVRGIFLLVRGGEIVRLNVEY